MVYLNNPPSAISPAHSRWLINDHLDTATSLFLLLQLTCLLSFLEDVDAETCALNVLTKKLNIFIHKLRIKALGKTDYIS